MKNFIKTIGLTFYSGDFYKKIKEEKAGKGIGFLAKTVLFFGISLSIVGLVVFLAFFPSIKKQISNFINTNYPDKLVVTLKDGKMTTADNQPFFLKIPDDSIDKKNNKENYIAIIPNEKMEASLLVKYNTLIAVASDGVVSERNNGQEVRIIKYGNQSFTLDKNFALKLANSLFFFAIIFFVIAFVPFLLMVLFIVVGVHLIWLFFVALLIWGFLRLKKLKVSYQGSYRIGVYAIVPLFALEIITFPLHLSGRLFSIAIILAVVLLVTRKWEAEKIFENIDTTNNQVIK